MKVPRRWRIVQLRGCWHVQKREETACGLLPPFDVQLTEGIALVDCPTCRASLGDARGISGVDNLGHIGGLRHRVRRYVKVAVTAPGLIDHCEPRMMSACGVLGARKDPRRDGVVNCLECLGREAR